MHRGVESLGTWPGPTAVGEPRQGARHYDDGGVAAVSLCECNDVVAMRSADLERLIGAVCEDRGKLRCAS